MGPTHVIIWRLIGFEAGCKSAPEFRQYLSDLQQPLRLVGVMNIRDSGFFVIRTPLFPFREALKWSESLTCTELYKEGANTCVIQDAWLYDLTLLRGRLLAVLQKPATQQALAVASPSLHRAIAAWQEFPDSKKGLQAERALTKYFMRMTGRSTPFGLFSGCSVGTTTLSAPTQVMLAPQTQYRTTTRLDFDYITTVTTAMRDDLSMRVQLRYSANSSLHRTSHGWHYIECRSSGAKRSYHLAKLESDVYLDTVIASVKDRDLMPHELAAFLSESTQAFAELSPDEITPYLNTLIDSDVIVPSILPRLTGDGALRGLLGDLRDIPYARNVYNILSGVDQALIEFDKRPLTVGAHEYLNIAEHLKRLPGTLDPERIVQVDMFKPVQIANLGKAVIVEIENALRVLCSFSQKRDLPKLTSFRELFVERYEQAWVPLAEALDPELGIGYGDARSTDDSPLLSGLGPASDFVNEKRSELDPFQSFLLQKLVDSSAAGSSEIDISGCDLPKHSSMEELLPETFSVLVSLVSESTEALSKDNFQLVFKSGQGPSSVRSIARFCSSDHVLKDLVKSTLREEEASDPEAVFAEIVYQPEGRAGNVICRPLLRDYEIPVMGRSGAPVEQQLAIEDLLVGVAHGRVTLFSRSLQRRIQPRLSSAHNYGATGLSVVYRFLCDLQNQGGLDVPSFKWGPLSKLRSLPRVRIGRVVLARAQWTLRYTDIAATDVFSRFEGFLRIKQLQSELGVPRWVLLSEQDSTLPLDLDNPLCVDSLLQLLKRSNEIVLLETYPGSGNQSVIGPEGAFEHELVIPLIKARQPATAPIKSVVPVTAVHTAAGLPRTERLVPPGGTWHYVKIYGGDALLEELLTQDLGPILTTLCEVGSAIDWFFVRYADPQPHIRLRFRARRAEALEIVTGATKRILATSKAWKIQWDTYHREIERYGGSEAMVSSEELFCADSEATLTILRTLDPEDPDMRWKSALLGMNKFLTDCGISILEKVQLANRMRHSFAKELRVTDRYKHAIGTQFRHERTALEGLLHGDSWSTYPKYESVFEAYQLRSYRIQSAVERLRLLDDRGQTVTPFIDIVASHLHMNLNRMMRSEPRAHEFVLYEYLHRLCESERVANRSGHISLGGEVLKRQIKAAP